jgi:tryptophan-rich sensory protein
LSSQFQSSARSSRPSSARALSRARPPLQSGLALVAWVVVVCAAGAGAGMLFPPGDWYASLAKPTWNPPSWLFGPAWTLLYVLLGTSAWLVWREPGVPRQERRRAWRAFAVHAVLNLAWTPLFFGLRQPGLAFAEIVLVWIAALWMTIEFGRVRPLAGYLLVPLVLWVSFALTLNGTLWLLNT